MSNLIIFENQTAEIFSILYSSFPIKTDIYRHQILKDKKPVDAFQNPIEVPTLTTDYKNYYFDLDFYIQDDDYKNESKIFEATMAWLSSSGYINHTETNSHDYVEDVVLTAKGLEVLNGTPNSIDGSLSLGDKLKKESIKVSSDITRDLVKQVLLQGFKLVGQL